jgi:hypothetical protein
MSTTETTYLHDLDRDAFLDLRTALRTAYDVYADARTAASALVLSDSAGFVNIADYVAALDAAEAEFDSHISFKKSVYSRDSYRRYCLLFDGIVIGGVTQDSRNSDWHCWTTNRTYLTSSELASDRTRKVAARYSIEELAIDGNLGERNHWRAGSQ